MEGRALGQRVAPTHTHTPANPRRVMELAHHPAQGSPTTHASCCSRPSHPRQFSWMRWPLGEHGDAATIGGQGEEKKVFKDLGN